jgi:hypothetical protein
MTSNSTLKVFSSSLSREFSEHENTLKKRQREGDFYIINGQKKSPSDMMLKTATTFVYEDHPDLALEREKLLNQCLDLLATENEKYGPMTDNSKTSQACRTKGMRVGLQGLFARIVWFELLNQISTLGDIGSSLERDSIFPVAFAGDQAVINELIAAGRSEKEAKDIIMNKVGKKLMKYAEHLISMKKQLFQGNSKLLLQPVAIQLSKVPEIDNPNRISFYQLSYHNVVLEISYEHFKKLLRLYRLHTDQKAHLQDITFVS